MSPWLNIWLNLQCVLHDLGHGNITKFNFHARGCCRALHMILDDIVERFGGRILGSTGGMGIASFWMSTGHMIAEGCQLVLLILSIASVSAGLYITWPKFKREWRSRHLAVDDSEEESDEDDQ